MAVRIVQLARRIAGICPVNTGTLIIIESVVGGTATSGASQSISPETAQYLRPLPDKILRALR